MLCTINGLTIATGIVNFYLWSDESSNETETKFENRSIHLYRYRPKLIS